MLTLDQPAKDKAVGNLQYKESRTKKPIIMNHEIIAYTINRGLVMPSELAKRVSARLRIYREQSFCTKDIQNVILHTDIQ